jgi:hypothetical protein
LILKINGRFVTTLQEYDALLAKLAQSGAREMRVNAYAEGRDFNVRVKFD